MPNKCVRCGKIFPDDSKEILNGCDVCGSKFFFYIRPEALEKAERELKALSKNEIEEIERDIRRIISIPAEEEETVVLDLEAIRVIKPGKYKIDVVNLFNQRPIVIRVGPGRYEIDLSTLMTRLKRKPRWE